MFADATHRSESGTRWIRRILLGALALLAALGFGLTKLELESEESQLRARLHHQPEVTLPSANLLRYGTLNFETFAADLLWIQALQYFGRQSRRNQPPVSLEEFATTIANLDPYFYQIYPWFAATYRGSHFPISVEDVQTMNRFLDRGIDRFPSHWRLPYKAGMNYIGYSQDRTTKERLREINSAIDYLQKASMLPGAPSTLPLTISYLYERRRQLKQSLDNETVDAGNEAIAGQARVKYLTDIYFLIEDQTTRKKLRAMLRQSPEGRQALKQRVTSFRKQFTARKQGRWNFLPTNAWSWNVASHTLPIDFASIDAREHQ